MERTETRRRSPLGWAALAYLSAIVVLVTLVPFTFRWPDALQVVWGGSALDVLSNVALFLPVGFFARLAGRPRRRGLLAAVVWGLTLSALVETAQAFVPGRYTQPLDVAMNGLGTLLGAHAFDLVARRLSGLAGVPALELPLVGILYLLVPLLWLDGLAAGDDPHRIWLVALLGTFGAGVVVSVHVHRLRPAGVISAARLSLSFGVAFLVGVLPALPRFAPAALGLGAALAAGVFLAARFLPPSPGDRRFEVATLVRLAPLYVAYLALLALWPWDATAPGVPFGALPLSTRLTIAFRLVEGIAAFTLLGYIVAEVGGRHDGRDARALARVALVAAACAVAVDAGGRAFLVDCATPLAAAPLVGASLFGGAVYRLQLAALRRSRSA